MLSLKALVRKTKNLVDISKLSPSRPCKNPEGAKGTLF